MGQPVRLFDELKRRNVFRVGSAYVVAGWLILQVADVILNNLDLPSWIFPLLLISLAVGFPLALLLAWHYEFTPEGVKKDSELDGSSSNSWPGSNRLNYFIIGGLLVAVVYYAFFKNYIDEEAGSSVDALIARPSVIVLPFENISGDKDTDHLAFGFTDELITGLQRAKEFPVVSRYASLEFRGSEMSASEYAASLGASYRLEGSFSLNDDNIRVLATLSGVDDKQVWAERFNGVSGSADILEIADELVAKVVAAVLHSEVQRVTTKNHPSIDAWEHYVAGLSVVMDFDPEKYEAAREHFDRAIEIAPDMAEAWAAMGDLEVDHYVSQPMKAETDFDQLNTIIGYFQKSHEINPFNGSACGCLGFMLAVIGQADEAQAVFKQALEANPLSAGLRIDYATFLLWDGRYESALENVDIALRLGTYGEGQSIAWLIRSIAAFAQGDTELALEAVNRALFISKGPFVMPSAIALLYILDKPSEASRMLNEMRESFPGISHRNPMLYVMLKPIDDVLSKRQAGVGNAGPSNVDEIYGLLLNFER